MIVTDFEIHSFLQQFKKKAKQKIFSIQSQEKMTYSNEIHALVFTLRACVGGWSEESLGCVPNV